MEKFRNLWTELKSLPALISASSKELKSTRSLTGAALLAALNVIINQFTIFFNSFMRLGFSFLAVGVSGLLYGPIVTGTIGIAADVLKFLFHSDGGAFFPGFTLNEFLLGFLYGAILYRKPVTFARTLTAQLVSMLTVNLLLTPLWLSMMYGQAFAVMVPARLIKNLIMLPVSTAMLYFVLKKVSETRVARTGW